jgi:hypothetical protein
VVDPRNYWSSRDEEHKPRGKEFVETLRLLVQRYQASTVNHNLSAPTMSRPPLLLALSLPDPAQALGCVKVLIEAKVDVNSSGVGEENCVPIMSGSAVWHASHLTSSTLAHTLLDAGAQLSEPPIEILAATAAGHIDLVVRMLGLMAKRPPVANTSSPSSSSSSSSSNEEKTGAAASMCVAAMDASPEEDQALLETTTRSSTADDEEEEEEEDKPKKGGKKKGDDDDGDEEGKEGDEKKAPVRVRDELSDEEDAYALQRERDDADDDRSDDEARQTFDQLRPTPTPVTTTVTLATDNDDEAKTNGDDHDGSNVNGDGLGLTSATATDAETKETKDDTKVGDAIAAAAGDEEGKGELKRASSTAAVAIDVDKARRNVATRLDRHAPLASKRSYLLPSDILSAAMDWGQPAMMTFWLSGARTLAPGVKVTEWTNDEALAAIHFNATRYFPSTLVKRVLYRLITYTW